MAAVPKSFNIETAQQDFAGPDRLIEVVREDGIIARRQMKITVGPWTVSCIWGTGAYATGARDRVFVDLPAKYVESPDAEVAAWREDEAMIEIDGDSVIGWVSPQGVLDALAAAARDDEDGIRAALISEAE